MGKIIESIIAEIISYLVEEHQLIPTNHIGGQPGQSTEDALMLLSESIYQAWKHGKVYSLILMNVSEAFNNVHHARLIHNLRQRRIPHTVIP
jgi:hypothetical protein